MIKVRKGFIAIFLVIALLAFSLSLSTAVTYLSINESQSALALSNGVVVLSLAEGCAEDSLLLAVRDENYTGGAYEYLGGVCNVSVAKNGTAWTLDISASKNNFTRSLEIIVDRQPGLPSVITLQSWLEQ